MKYPKGRVVQRTQNARFAAPHQWDFGCLALYSQNSIHYHHHLMSDAKPIKAAPAIDPFGVNSPAKAAQVKKNRDGRRKSIRSQNARSKVK
jgi:hypothetical protein